jgi:hypothetical protein
MEWPALARGSGRRAASVGRRLRLLMGCLLGLALPAHLLALDPTRAIARLHHTSWTLADGMPANIWAIAQTPDGYLWLGSVNGLYRFDGVRVERIAADRLPSPGIRALAATASGGCGSVMSGPWGRFPICMMARSRTIPSNWAIRPAFMPLPRGRTGRSGPRRPMRSCVSTAGFGGRSRAISAFPSAKAGAASGPLAWGATEWCGPRTPTACSI